MDRKKIVQIAKRSLRKSEGKKALNYLKEHRGISNAIIDEFNFGYCPSNVNHQLKDRIITPIYDLYGEVVALSTRSMTIPKGEKNHFWHESFDKSFYLYGLCCARDNIIKYKKVIIVEGEFDVAALHSYGFNMAVGICGSAFSLAQTSLLSRFCSDFYLVFDRDEAGDFALKRSIEMYDEFNLDIYGIRYIPVKLPNNTDPDKYIRENGKHKFKELLAKTKEEYNLIN